MIFVSRGDVGIAPYREREVSDVFCRWRLHGTDGVRCFFVVGICTGADGGGYFFVCVFAGIAPCIIFSVTL